MSFPFPERIRREMLVRDIRNRFPQTREVFDRLGVRVPCWDCSLAEIAPRSGKSLEELLDLLNQAVAAKPPEDERERSDAP
ncbi:MAG: hypothetical protein ACE5IP_01885 [Terriglobia bacterium]